MSRYVAMLFLGAVFCRVSPAQSGISRDRAEAEYYVQVYAQRYGVPLAFVQAIVQQESGWRRCAVSPKGAVGLMQLMPRTAKRLGVADRCNVKENVAGGVRYLALLMREFHGDLRLVAAAYHAPEQIIARRGLNYSNRDVVNYVACVRALYRRNLGLAAGQTQGNKKGNDERRPVLVTSTGLDATEK